MKQLRAALVATLLAVTLLAALTFGPSPASASHWSYEDTINRPDLHQGHADVLRLYWAFFDRQPDVNGSQYWITLYDSCEWGTGRIAQFFSESPEFVDTYGAPTNEEFVDLVYANVFDRTPDAAGRIFWLGRLADGQSRGALVADLAFSPEFRADQPLPSDGRANTGCTPASDPHHDPGSLLLAFTEAWQERDWTAMAVFATEQVVMEAQADRADFDDVRLDPSDVAAVLETCGHPGSGEWSCSISASPPSGPELEYQIVLLGDGEDFSVIFLAENS